MGTFLNNTSKDVNINKEDFFKACRNGDKKYVEKALKKDKSLANAKENEEQTVLMETVSSGHIDIVELLINNGADVNAKNKYGNCALLIAASNGSIALLQLLISKGADLKGRAGDVIVSAAMAGRKEIVELLLNMGVYIDTVDEFGCTALMGAASTGKKDVALLAEGRI